MKERHELEMNKIKEEMDAMEESHDLHIQESRGIALLKSPKKDQVRQQSTS